MSRVPWLSVFLFALYAVPSQGAGVVSSKSTRTPMRPVHTEEDNVNLPDREQLPFLPSLTMRNSAGFAKRWDAGNFESELIYPINDTHVIVVNEEGDVSYRPFRNRKRKPPTPTSAVLRTVVDDDDNAGRSLNGKHPWFTNCKTHEDCTQFFGPHSSCMGSFLNDARVNHDVKSRCQCNEGYFYPLPKSLYHTPGTSDYEQGFPYISEEPLVDSSSEYGNGVAFPEHQIGLHPKHCQQTAVKVGGSCEEDKQCRATDMYSHCSNYYCTCVDGYYYSTNRDACLRIATLMQVCEEDLQCENSDPYSYCRTNGGTIGICSCKYRFTTDGIRCLKVFPNPKIKSSKPDEIYKIAMIAASCFLVGIIGLILTYIIRRSFFRRRRAGGFPSRGSESDVYSVENDARFAGIDKPPSYLDVVREVEAQYGIPPPAYDSLPSTSSGIGNRVGRQPRFHPPPEYTSASAARNTTQPEAHQAPSTSTGTVTGAAATATPTAPPLSHRLLARSIAQLPVTRVVISEEGDLERTVTNQPESTDISQESTPVAERRALISEPSDAAGNNTTTPLLRDSGSNSNRNPQLLVQGTSTPEQAHGGERGFRNEAFTGDE